MLPMLMLFLFALAIIAALSGLYWIIANVAYLAYRYYGGKMERKQYLSIEWSL